MDGDPTVSGFCGDGGCASIITSAAAAFAGNVAVTLVSVFDNGGVSFVMTLVAAALAVNKAVTLVSVFEDGGVSFVFTSAASLAVNVAVTSVSVFEDGGASFIFTAPTLALGVSMAVTISGFNKNLGIASVSAVVAATLGVVVAAVDVVADFVWDKGFSSFTLLPCCIFFISTSDSRSTLTLSGFGAASFERASAKFASV